MGGTRVTKMPDSVRSETIGELQIWIAGKFELLKQSQEVVHNDLTVVRNRVHDLANEVGVLMAANLPEKVKLLEAADKLHGEALERIKLEAVERKATIATLKAVYAVIGALAGSGITLAFELYRISHN